MLICASGNTQQQTKRNVISEAASYKFNLRSRDLLQGYIQSSGKLT